MKVVLQLTNCMLDFGLSSDSFVPVVIPTVIVLLFYFGDNKY